jgi:hypothetical protein
MMFFSPQSVMQGDAIVKTAFPLIFRGCSERDSLEYGFPACAGFNIVKEI